MIPQRFPDPRVYWGFALQFAVMSYIFSTYDFFSCFRIIFDGDVDPEWVENINSVLDDNRLLTLPNGERLSLPPNVRIMFEVQDLKYATLATVSRCGMVSEKDFLEFHSTMVSFWKIGQNFCWVAKETNQIRELIIKVSDELLFIYMILKILEYNRSSLSVNCLFM